MTITEEIIQAIESNPRWQAKMDRQTQLEERMLTLGVDRYWNNARRAAEEGAETRTAPVRYMLSKSLDPVSQRVEQFVFEAFEGNAKKTPYAAKILGELDAETVAYVTCRAVLDGITRSVRMVTVAHKVGLMLQDEIQFRQLQETDKERYESLRKKYEKQSNHYRHKRNAMRSHMRDYDVEWQSWSASELIAAGGKAVELMAEVTGLVDVVERRFSQTRSELVVIPTADTFEWLKNAHDQASLLSPVLMPTIVPPRPWTSVYEGGYWTDRFPRRMTLVKVRSRGHLQELADHHMPDVYDAINAMQHTAWVVNGRVLDVAKHLWDVGTSVAAIPQAEDVELPAKPEFLGEKEKDAWSAEEAQEFRDWKREATDIYTYNASLKSNRLRFLKLIHVADTFRDEEEIYFPHQFDFRGRCYAMPMFLNPQGDDFARGLLEFANGVAINDEESRSWLAIHGSNCYGNDKVPLAERVQWVEDNEDWIRSIAADPLADLSWADTDKPWQFLAWCMEWVDFLNEGYGYISTLPVQMDGSCNGLQNFSAALRDAVGGAAVNLIPADQPQDIYQRVADVVLEQVKKDAAGAADDDTMKIAQGWLKHGVTRSVTKRPVMTLAYGAKEYGFRMQVLEDTVGKAKIDMTTEFPWEGTGWHAAGYMGKVIWDRVGTVVVAARQAMDWFQNAASLAAAEGLPVRWTTPDGLVVLQAYPRTITKRIRLTFNNRIRDVTAQVGESRVLDRRRQANGISPNWVHSMDASHMRATLRAGWKEGLRSFSLIHDSYGTHAGNTAALAAILREQFVEMYRDDVLESFKKELQTQLPETIELPPLPPTGDLDLEAVKDSLYFFA